PFSAALGVDGFSGMVLKPWKDRHRTVTQIMPEVQGKLLAIPGLQIFASRPSALPGGSNFPVEFVIASTADSERLLEYAQKISMKAMEKRGVFWSPPQIDLKFDQPQSEIVINHDKAAALGVNLSQIGADLSSALGGNFVNRFNIE